MTIVETTALFRNALDAHRQGNLTAATRIYTAVIARDPGNAPSHFLLSMILRSTQQVEAALPHARLAVRIAPLNPRYQQGLAEVLLSNEQFAEAEQAFRRSVLCDPAHAAAWAWLRGRKEQLGDLPAAERVARLGRHLSGDGTGTTAHAEILARLGDVETAWPLADRAARQTSEYDPLADLKSGLMLPPIPVDRDQIAEARQRLSDALDRAGEGRLRLEEPVNQLGRVPFYLAFHGLDDRPLAERFNDLLRAATPAFLEPRQASASGEGAGQGGRARVGIFSSFFNAHTVLRYTQGLIRAMAARPDLEAIAIPTASIPPEARRHLESLGAAVAPVSSDYPRAAAQIREMRLSVLIFADIGMEPLSAALAHTDLAARRIALSGHPVTTGIRGLDGYVTSPIFEPEDCAAHYTEPLIHAPFWPLGYVRSGPDPATLPAPDRDLSRPALLCVQSLFKIHPDMDAAFQEILARVPDALLYFVDLPIGLKPLTDRFRRRLATAGIDVDRRVRFLPRMQLPHYLGWLRGADVVLDTWYFSGGDSSLSALAVGAPIVTRQGAFYRGRQTAALLREAGVTETVASTSDAYIDLVASLATDPERAEDVRRRIENGAGRLFGRNDGADDLIDRIVRQT